MSVLGQKRTLRTMSALPQKRTPRQRHARQHRSRRRCASWSGSSPAPTRSWRSPTRRSPPAKTDQAKARAEELKQRAAAKAAEAGTQLDRAKADAKSKLDAAAAAKAAAKAAETKKA